MRNLILLFALLFFGCTKSDVEPNYKISGEWVLMDAELYIKKWDENGVINPMYRFDWLNDTINQACLNLYGSDILLDNIFKDSTTYKFDDVIKKLTLNGVKTYQYKPFTTYYTTLSVFPTEDGSARIYTVDDISENYLRLTESGREQALYFNGEYDNHTYYSKLTFKKKGTTASYDLKPGLETAIYSGLVPNTLPYSNELTNEKWVIYEYRLEGSSFFYNTFSDTLTFISSTKYKSSMAGIQTENYVLANYGSYYRLKLGHTGLSAGLDSQEIPLASLSNGEIKRIGFLQLIPNGGLIYLSMKKIQ